MVIEVFGNGTASSVTWVPESNGRGTWTILSSCIVTLLLCIWSAVHTNVPEHRQGTVLGIDKSNWRKTGCAILGWVAPDVVAFFAWRQRRKAAEIRDSYNKCFEESKAWPWWLKWLGRAPTSNKPVDIEHGKDRTENQNAMKSELWTLQHGFVGLMGGFAVDFRIKSGDGNALGRQFMTTDCALLLARHWSHLLPRVSSEDIEDKSKANDIAKILLCVQATWFCVQTIYRMATGFAVSLLELNTFGHAICALITYVIWWDKPFDLREPFILSDQNDLTPVVLLYMASAKRSLNGRRCKLVDPVNSSGISLPSTMHGPSVHRVYGSEHDLHEIVPEHNYPCDPSSQDILSESSIHKSSIESGEADDSNNLSGHDGIFSHGVQDDLSDHNVLVDHNDSSDITPANTQEQNSNSMHKETVKTILPNNEFPGAIFKSDDDSPAHLEAEEVEMWEHLSTTYKQLSIEIQSSVYSITNRRYRQKRLFQSRIRNSDGLTEKFSFTDQEDDVLFRTVLAVTSIFYGGLHIAAWTADFPSHAEKLLWQMSGVIVMGSFPTVLLKFVSPRGILNSLVKPFLGKPLIKRPIVPKRIRRSRHVSAFGNTILTLIITAYCLARGYLVIESFVQLFRLPRRAFETPEWTQYVPHIT